MKIDDLTALNQLFTGARQIRLDEGAEKYGQEDWQRYHPVEMKKLVMDDCYDLHNAMVKGNVSRAKNLCVDMANRVMMLWGLLIKEEDTKCD
ncbi:hypothetical protein LCGC14_1795130 [marine sediment metagenome]|uniref:dATP/dGTP diphosphohydrolase N-terminal domain-containing protein n=1 Tax=marine sediment metagenome TaxID=412755 RepID=A0A0F9J653_9ZZZZ